MIETIVSQRDGYEVNDNEKKRKKKKMKKEKKEKKRKKN